MTEYAYTPSPGKLEALLKHIQEAGVPSKVTIQYLKGAGFTSSNDRYLMGVLKHFGFIDASGHPTERWRAFRNRAEAGRVMSEALAEGYPGLYQTYPDAHLRPPEVLRNWFSANVDASDVTLARIVGTLKQLGKHAGGTAPQLPRENGVSEPDTTRRGSHGGESVPATRGAPRPGHERYESEGVLLEVIPTRKNLDKIRKMLDVLELEIED